MKPLDIEFMKQLHDKVNIIPVIAKADTMTPEEVAEFKATIMDQITAAKIKIYDFPESYILILAAVICFDFPEMADGEEQDRKEDKKMKERLPFAVVGSNMILEIDGKKTRGRKYPWGVVDIENVSHCDFVPLRNMLVRTNLLDLKEVTNSVFYENYRRRTLYEEEEKQHEERVKRMEEDHKNQIEKMEQAHLERMLEVIQERKKEFDPSFWGVREKIRKFSL